jgi:DNA-binding beta-propeller fold protein YncE
VVDHASEASRPRGATVKLKLILTTAIVGMALALPTVSSAAPAAGTVYVTNVNPVGLTAGSVSQYSIGAGGLLSQLSPATVAAGIDPFGIAVSPSGGSAYVANLGSFDIGNVSQYDVDPLTGALTPKTPPSVISGHQALAVRVSPDGKSAYVPALDSIWQYDIDPVTGTLSPKNPASVPTDTPFAPRTAVDLAVSPDGKNAYVVAGPLFGGVLQFDIDPLTGALSPKTPPEVAAGFAAHGVVVTPDGRSAYVANINDNTISEYSIDPATGNLSPKDPATVATGTGPTDGLAVAPDGKSLYVGNSGISGPAGPGPGIWQYDIDPVSGVLTPKTPTVVAWIADSTKAGLAITPDGRNLYSTCLNVVCQYSIDHANGTLTPKIPATVTAGVTGEGFVTSVAVGPMPRVPTSKDQCKNGGWRNFPQFKNEGLCIAFVNHGP